MARIFYTERDIEDLARRGVHEIAVNDDVYLTDLAREKMESLGVRTLASGQARSSSAPSSPTVVASSPLSDAERKQVMEKVRAGVIAKLGPGVDTALVDTVVRRVVGQL